MAEDRASPWWASNRRIRLPFWKRWRNAWEMFWVYLRGDGQGNLWPMHKNCNLHVCYEVRESGGMDCPQWRHAVESRVRRG